MEDRLNGSPALLPFVDEGVSQEFALTFEGLAGGARLLNQTDFLRQESGQVQRLGLTAAAVAEIQRVVGVDVDDRALVGRLGPVGPKVIQTASDSALAEPHP